MTRISTSLAALLAAAFSLVPHAQAQTNTFKPVTDAVLENPDPSDWLHLNRTIDQQRFSPLDQINKSNVGQLKMAWARGLPNGTQESVPIVYQGVMYVYSPGGSIQAVNATNGDLIWEYTRDYPKEANAQAGRNKSLGIYEDMIFFAAPDGYLVAIDMKTGKERWATKADDGGQTAGGILMADGKVLTNRTCIAGTRPKCFIAAHDAKTGKEVWRFYTTAGEDEPGGDTWGKVATEKRAASPWGLPGSYDPARKVTYWGVANPDPYTRLTRHGAHDAVPFTAPVDLYSNSSIALDTATGQLKWYYQELPGDDWDADHIHERVLAKVRLNPDPKHVKWISESLPRGEERDVVITVGEGGGLYVVERDSGKFLWAHPFPYDVPDFNTTGIDLKSGKVHINVDKLFKKDGDQVLTCFHNVRGLWSIAYNPTNNSLYIPFQDQCLTMSANAKAKTGWGPRRGVMRPGIDPNKYMNLAKIDMSTGEMKILHSQAQASAGSALVTAGNLMFWGDQNRRFRAFDSETGQVLWESILGGMVMNSTITYAVDGKQYVMVFTGEGQSVSAGPLGLTQSSMAKAVRGHNSVFVFALP
jgi:alcohol dehydrogenase (cytochrome c)